MAPPRKYLTIAERTKAQRERERIRYLPRKLATVRLRHLHVVKEIKRAALDELLAGDERDWS